MKKALKKISITKRRDGDDGPGYCYCFVLADRSKFKVGYTRSVRSRMISFCRLDQACESVFCLEKSFVIRFPNVNAAMATEKLLLGLFHEYRAETAYDGTPSGTPWGAGGHKEWLHFDCYEMVRTLAQNFEWRNGQFMLVDAFLEPRMKELNGVVSHHEREVSELRGDPELALEYLKAALELIDTCDDPLAGFLAFGTVAEAYGDK